tara:strand:- start:91 stop:663 length:573 start_codon:yes stop_codon:yes gene_type:complete
MKKFREIREGVNEVSKGMVGRYLKKATPSAADGGRDSVMGSGKEKQGVKKVINRITGTRTAVDKMTGKAKVPATEDRRMGSITVNTDQERKDRAAKARAKMATQKTAEIKKRHADEIKKGIRLPDYSKKQKEDSDAVKAFLAKGGKIKKLPPGKAQGYHGKDDPGKGMHGMMDKPDTKGFKKSKFVRSMK